MGADKYTVQIVQIHRSETVRFSAIAAEAYLSFLSMLFQTDRRHFAIRKAFDASLTGDIEPLVQRLRKILTEKRRAARRVLILEVLDVQADADVYDDLANALFVAMSKHDVPIPHLLVVVSANPKVCDESVLIERKLIPFCERKKIAFLVVSDGGGGIKVKAGATFLDLRNEPTLTIHPKVEEPHSVALPNLPLELIKGMTSTLFGHFEIQFEGSKFHLPVMLSLKILASSDEFVRQLRRETSDALGTTFSVMPIGIESGGIRELAISLIEGDTTRLLYSVPDVPRPKGAVVVLCDFVGPMYPLQRIVDALHVAGYARILIKGISRFANTPPLKNCEVHAYLDTGYLAYSPEAGECVLCHHEIPLIRGETFDDFSRQVGEYDTATFWQLVGEDPKFYDVGHWASDRTTNHYQFRILAQPLLHTHGYDVAVRIRNVLVSRSIIPRWIQKIVCPEEPEAEALAATLSQVIGLQSGNIIAIPRESLRTTAGKYIDPSLPTRLDTTYGMNALRGRNVIIVDQAAHHFKTLSALRSVCEHYDCVILAFAVLLDRTGPELSIGEYLHDSHYVRLYSWPSPPRRNHECACIGARR